MYFQDRHDAGKQLARKLDKYRDKKPFILALPRGGVVIGAEVAKALNAPLDVIVVRKLGAPLQPELGFGAVAPNGIRVLNMDIMRLIGITEPMLEHVTGAEVREMERRLALYRGNRPMPDLAHRTVIIVDDGLATGITALAAIHCVKGMRPDRVILAVPVSSPETADSLRREVDDLVIIEEPPDFLAVGVWYRRFDQVTDEEVINLLNQARQEAERR